MYCLGAKNFPIKMCMCLSVAFAGKLRHRDNNIVYISCFCEQSMIFILVPLIFMSMRGLAPNISRSGATGSFLVFF